MPSESELPPLPPVSPDLEECCGSGCNPCIFDVYEVALERYRAELEEWRKRHEIGRQVP